MANSYSVTEEGGGARVQATLDTAAVLYVVFRNPTNNEVIYVATSSPDPSASISSQAATSHDFIVNISSGTYNVEFIPVTSTEVPAIVIQEKATGFYLDLTTQSAAYIYVLIKHKATNDIVKVLKYGDGTSKHFTDFIPIKNPGAYLFEYLASDVPPTINLLYNTTSGSTLDYNYQYKKNISLATDANTTHVYQLTGYDNLITQSNANTISPYTYFTNILDMGSVYLYINSLFAINKSDGSIAWSELDWDNTGSPYYMSTPRVVADIDKIWVFNYGTTLYLVTDVTTGALTSIDLTTYGTYEDMFALPDGSVLLCPYGTPNGDIARATFNGTNIVIDNTFGSGSGLNLAWGMDIQCNIGHALDGSAYYVSEYDTIKAYSMTDGSLMWTYTRNNSSVDETFQVHPVTGNIICDENTSSGTSSNECDVVEIDKATGTVVHTQHFTEFADMNVTAMDVNGNLFLAEDMAPQRWGFLDLSATPWTFTAVPSNPVDGGNIAYQWLGVSSTTNGIMYFANGGKIPGVVAIDSVNKTVQFIPLMQAGKAPPDNNSYTIVSAEDDTLLFMADSSFPYKMSVTDLGLPNELSPATQPYAPANLPDGYYETGNATWGPTLAYIQPNSGIYGQAAPSSTTPAYVVNTQDVPAGTYTRVAMVSEIYDGVLRFKGNVEIPGGPANLIPMGERADGTIACLVASSSTPVQTGFLDPVNLTWTAGGNLPDNNARYYYTGGNYGMATNGGDFYMFVATSSTMGTYKNASGTTTWTAGTVYPQTVSILTPAYTNSVYYVLGISGTTGYMYSYDPTNDTWTALTAPPALPSSFSGGATIIDAGGGPTIMYPRLGVSYNTSTDAWAALTGWNTTIFNKYLKSASGAYWGSSNHASNVIYLYNSASDDKQIAYGYPAAALPF